MFKDLYLRIRYWRQLRKGFKLLPSEGKKTFVLVDSRAILMNGKDPLVSVDLRNSKVTQWKPAKKESNA